MSNTANTHEWHPVQESSAGRAFGRAEWRVCKRCGIVQRSDSQAIPCVPQAPLQNHSPYRREGAFV